MIYGCVVVEYYIRLNINLLRLPQTTNYTGRKWSD